MATVSTNCGGIGNICLELLPQLQKILPDYTSYKVLDLKKWNETGFTCILRTTLSTKEDAIEWVKLFEKTSLTTYRVDRTYRENSQRLAFKKLYHCHQNTKPRSHNVKNPHPKHVNCNSKLTITIKQKHMRRSKDPYLKDYPCEIYLRYNHNHPIETPEALQYRRPTEGVKKIFLTLFENGHTPISALKKHKLNLTKKYGEGGCATILADRAHCPNAKWCYDLYRNVFKKGKLVENNRENVPIKIENLFFMGDETAIHENLIVKEGLINAQQRGIIANSRGIEASPQSVLDVENELASCFDVLKQKIETNPGLYFGPAKSFISKFQLAAATSEDCFVSFLNNFETVSGTGAKDMSVINGDNVSNSQPKKTIVTEEIIYDVTEHGYSKKTDNDIVNENEAILILSDESGVPITNMPIWQYVTTEAEVDSNFIISC